MEEERWRWKEGGGESGRRGGHREERRTQEEWEGEKWDRERE